MEPWFGNHGNDEYPPKVLFWENASMEPWFGNHGNPDGAAPTNHPAQASMEPWFGNHGNRGPLCRSSGWSTGFNGAVVR